MTSKVNEQCMSGGDPSQAMTQQSLSLACAGDAGAVDEAVCKQLLEHSRNAPNLQHPASRQPATLRAALLTPGTTGPSLVTRTQLVEAAKAVPLGAQSSCRTAMQSQGHAALSFETRCRLVYTLRQ